MTDRPDHEEPVPGTAGARVDTSVPNVARMYDYYLGGAANFAVDREAAERALAVTPEIGRFARMNREFLGRVVRYLCERGIDQFLDLGSGVPTVGNVHEIAHQHNPRARIAYVDHESVAVAHARALLADEPDVSVTQADIRNPAEVLAAPGVAGLLDFSRPVAVLAVAILHFLPDADEPARILRTYCDACPAGSFTALSHAATITMTESESHRGQSIYRSTKTPLVLRDREQIAALLDGCRLVEPGLTPINHWPSPTGESPANGYGAVAELR
ncbi:S-adenosyl methyltransferase [Saccharopolyspora antimicrobica]|uniref:S-adenosyl methyltransferase n=1 Tax=Saccharopolyspora antimicrobica TaxID=455193 RepID=A0A1I5CCI4_9PSEU|nr:SAM-dependent methyltransferase [Saccharopolyspora antimicrobica]RKT88900.1 S-adenosyl methyltransferase [Saccharopolyspora antimicrobica]SFN84725.1 S-adenosyl methyltransferase [Saccharopolyspora antimicrobica]